MEQKNLVSICIPTYEMKDVGVQYLEYSLEQIDNQSYKNVQVVISDHSQNSLIESLCLKWSGRLNIKYTLNSNKRGNSSANVNNAIINADGDIIKVLFQDDFLTDTTSLENQVQELTGTDRYWLATACCHLDLNGFIAKPHYPRYNNDIHHGINTISSPSVIMFWNRDVIFFDENLIWLMDVDYYKRLYDKFGLPAICNHICVVNREHSHQITNTIATDKIRSSETNYIVQKYA